MAGWSNYPNGMDYTSPVPRWAVQARYTFEWVTVSTHEDYWDAADATLALMDEDPDNPENYRMREAEEATA